MSNEEENPQAEFQDPSNTLQVSISIPKQVSYWLERRHEVLTLIATWLGLAVVIWVATSQNKIAREMAAEQNKVAREAAMQQNFIQFYEQWASNDMVDRRSRLAKALLDGHSDIKDDTPLVFFETLGNATRRGLVDSDLAWTTFYVDVVNYWSASRTYVEETRATEKCKCFYEEFENLKNRFLAEAPKRGLTDSRIGTSDSVDRFLQLEINLSANRETSK